MGAFGFAMADATLKAAKDNPNTQFAIIDNGNDSQVSNFTGVMFRAQEPSFVVGYIAARTTKTGKVGFVGGISSALIDQFEYGYRGGVAYANKEKGTNVEISAQYAESFSDAAKGKAIANSMYSDGCDIVFHAAGGVGTGVIEAAKDANKLAIGVDRDQAYLAPENVLTSALKRVNVAIVEISEKILRTARRVAPPFPWALPRTLSEFLRSTTSWARTPTRLLLIFLTRLRLALLFLLQTRMSWTNTLSL